MDGSCGIAFYGLLTFNSIAWAQITPVPGGISSIDSNRSLFFDWLIARLTNPTSPRIEKAFVHC